MSTFKLPNNEKQIIQSNVGDYLGNLWSSFNIDLDSSPGTIKTAPRLKRVIGADEMGSDIVQALHVYDGNYYIATNDNVLRCSVNNDPTDASNWSTISTLSVEDLGLETDMVSLNGNLLISLGTNILEWDGSAKDDDWYTNVAGGTALTTALPHTMEVLRSGKDTLFVTNGSVVQYYDGVSNTDISISTLQTANCLTPSLDRMWVGTYSELENNTQVYEFIVNNDQYEQSYTVDGRACLTMFTYKNTPFVITDRGVIQAFNGAGFQTVAQFPFATESKAMEGVRPGLIQDSPTGLAIHPKGAKINGDYCYIYVNTDNEYVQNDNLDERTPSGVWVLDMKTYSLTHKYALTVDSNDYGWHKVTRSGPLLVTNTPETRIMVGGEVNNDEEGVWMEGTETPQGYFTTVRHEVDSVRDSFNKLYVKADTLDTDETVSIKYKDTTNPGMPLKLNGITWLDATQFTTTDSIPGITVGDEVEILAGHYAGNLCHITAISGGDTKTITVDESFGTLNETSDVQIETWKKHNKQMTNESGELESFGSGETSPSRQYKVVLNGNIKVREIISESKNKNTT